MQPRHSAGEGHLRPDAIHGDLTSLPVLQSGEMGPETASGLWSGVSGVPGLGVSIPRPRHGALEEWDRHDRGESQRSGRRRSEMVGSRVELPRVLSPRSSSCRSSGRSTGSQGSSSAVMSGGSSGGSAKYSSHSRRSDSGFSGGGGRQRQEESHNHHHHQSKPLSSGGRSSRREGGKRSRRGEAAPSPCECVCTCGDPLPPKPVRRVMFSDESCSCSDDEKMKSLPVHVSEGRVRGERCCGPPSLPMRGHSMRGVREEERKEEERRDEESSGCCSASPVPSHYQRPKDVDGDYSYAYSDSVSPAFLIRVGATMDYSAEDEESKENIYEEIRDKSEEQLYQADSRKSSTSSHEVSTTSSTKSRFQKALEAVTRRSSRSLEHGDRDRSFHMSISKGRKKTLIDRASVDWDCDPERGSGMKSRLNKSSNDMLEEVGSCHNKVMNQLKLDVEDMLMPPPSLPGDDTQDDSGFHSGGMSSSTSTEDQMSKTKRKSIIKTSKSTKRSESQPGRMNRCESIDFKEMGHEPGRKPSDQFRTRSKILAEQGGYGHYGHLPAPGIYTVHPPPPILVQSAGKKGTVGKSYLSKLVSLPFLGGTRQQPPVVYGKNNNHPKSFGEEQGRAFYL